MLSTVSKKKQIFTKNSIRPCTDKHDEAFSVHKLHSWTPPQPSQDQIQYIKIHATVKEILVV